MGNLKVETLALGPVSTNCYLAANRETGALLILDPAGEPERITRQIARRQEKPEAILLTHGHFDHIGAVEALREQYGVPVCALAKELPLLRDPVKNLTQAYGCPLALMPDRLLEDGEELPLAGFQIRVIATPGHTAGSCCYYLPEEGVLFSGDTLFCESVGRTDFPTGDGRKLLESIRGKLFVLPMETEVYPGHGQETRIGYETVYNPYI